MEQHSFGYWLRLKRKALDLTREELAKQVGYSAATIRKIEDEERHPSVQVVERLAEVFKIPQDERAEFLSFARGDRRTAPGEINENAPWHNPIKSTRSNLPAPVTSLIGRKQEIADVREYLSNNDIRLVTLIGPPGIGKTRLGIEVARASLSNFSDGVFFVALAALDNPDLIAPTVAQALGYVGARNISPSDQIKEGIGDKQMLLVIDNCEHLIEDVSSLVSELLSTCSYLKILATSREYLRILGEWLYPVPALDVPTFDVPHDSSSIDITTISDFPALALFAERARAVRPDFALNSENIQSVSTICARLDGLPLAIELIAARMRLMSPEVFLTRMNNQNVLSADGMRAASDRQKTLNNAIEWSYNLLSEEEQKCFAYLSVFSGAFTLEVAESMFSPSFMDKPVSNLIASLLDKSLLQYDAPAPGETRYRMLVTIQEFARTQLKQMGEDVELRDRHLTYFLDLSDRSDKELRGSNQLIWLHRLEVLRDNLRSALEWAIETKQTEAAVQMARKLHWFWFVRGDHTEGRQWLIRVLDLPDAARFPESQAEALTQLAHHTWLQVGAEEARPLVERALAVARAHHDVWNVAKAHAVLGLVLIFEKKFAAAQSTLEESQPLFQEVGDKWGYAHSMMGLALQAFKQDHLTTSLVIHEQALVLFRELGDRYFQSAALRQMGNLRVKQGDLAGGVAALRDALLLAQDLNGRFEIYAVLWSFADAARHAENFGRAVRLYWAAKHMADTIGAWWQQDDIDLEDHLSTCRATLSESEFAVAAEEGRAMTMEQAIAYALEAEE